MTRLGLLAVLLFASAAYGEELHGTSVAAGPARACSVEVVKKGLVSPRWILANDAGEVYVVDTFPRMKGEVWEHVTTVDALVGKPRRITLSGEVFDAALYDHTLVVVDHDGDGEVAKVDLRTGVRKRLGGKAQGVVRVDDHVVAARVGPTRVEVETADGSPVAGLDGSWSKGPVDMAYAAGRLYFYVSPKRGPTAETLKATLVSVVGGQTNVVGQVHIGTALAASAGYVFVGSLTKLLRIAVGGAIESAPFDGAEMLVSDDKAAAYTNAELGTITLWPHDGAPYRACSGIDSPVGVALTRSHVYFTAWGKDGKHGWVGRFKR